MSSVDNVSGAGPTDEVQTPNEADGTKNRPQGARAPATINSLAKLKEEEPELYNKMMLAMGSEIANKWRKHPERLKQIRRESEKR